MAPFEEPAISVHVHVPHAGSVIIGLIVMREKRVLIFRRSGSTFAFYRSETHVDLRNVRFASVKCKL